jgi:hypothetical protein
VAVQAVDRKYEVCRLQVLVLDHNLIPQFVDVVIGESLYLLQFKVETNGDGEEPVLMEMDNFEGDDDHQGDNLNETHDTTSHTTPPQDKGNKEAAGVGGPGTTATRPKVGNQRVYHIELPIEPMLINKNAALKVSEQGAFDGMELGET